MRTRTKENQARRARRRTASLAGRTLSKDKLAGIQLMAAVHFARHFVNEHLFNKPTQVGRAYAAAYNRLIDRAEYLEAAASSATVGAPLALKPSANANDLS